MVLSTPEYLCFLAVVFLGFWLLVSSRPASQRVWAISLIAVANLFFYWRWGWIYLAAIPAAATVDFLLARAIPTKRWLIWISVLVNLALLALPKLPATANFLRLSLSFYAFQALSYTIDVYRGDAKPTYSWIRHLTSVTFFPTILQGPITRISELIPQWDKLKIPLSPADGGRALFLIALGAAKKFLIADYLGENLVNRIFDGPALYSGFECLTGVVGYAFQLYYDFSGYTDIALGSALLLGIKLPPNFNRPYESLNLAEFWRRWHISFSSWLRDYLYFALPGQRSQAMQYVNLSLTMVLGGLWHGFSVNFLIWGTIHGVGLAIVRWWQIRRGKKPYSASWIARFTRGFVTFLYVLLGWVFFRAETLEGARAVLDQIASGTIGFGNISPGFAIVLGVAIVAHYWPKDWYARVQQAFSASPALVQAAVLAALVACIEYVGATGSAPFVYQRF
jgi:alginate O-acetyltransferase complex protein AlgI